jgi:hypothetical protein
MEQKLQPLHAWAGDGAMMFLLCHCRCLFYARRQRALTRSCSVLMRVKNNTWIQLAVLSPHAVTTSPHPCCRALRST